MKADTFKHIDPDEFHDKGLTLHDCVADQISFEDHTLRFYLPDTYATFYWNNLCLDREW